MKLIKLFVLCLCVCLPESLAASNQPLRSTTYLGFNPVSGQNNLQQGIIYQFPDPERFGNGPYALFTWSPGTGELYWDALAYTFVTEMANRGFVGATVQYNNTNALQRCDDYTARARGVFDATRISSAVGVLCSLSGVSCNNGIVTAGISQGGALSIMAKNYAPKVMASFAMSISDFDMNFPGGVNLASCLDDQFTAIPPNRLMIVNGQSDVIFGGQTPLMNVSGYTCPNGTFQCWSPEGNGAGWYIVRDSQVADGVADHCYELRYGCFTLWGWEPHWFFEATYNWSLKPNLDWLASLGTMRVFSPTGQ